MPTKEPSNSDILKAIEEMRGEMGERFNNVDESFKGVEEGFDVVKKRLDGINIRLRGEEREKVA